MFVSPLFLHLPTVFFKAGQSTSPPSSSSWEPVAQCAVPSGPLSISPGGSLTCGATHSKPPPPSCSSGTRTKERIRGKEGEQMPLSTHLLRNIYMLEN